MNVYLLKWIELKLDKLNYWLFLLKSFAAVDVLDIVDVFFFFVVKCLQIIFYKN